MTKASVSNPQQRDLAPSDVRDLGIRPALLFLSISDGLDPRTNKEVATLSRKFTIDFVGVSNKDDRPFFTEKVRRVEMLRGRARSLLVITRLWVRVLRLLLSNRYDSVHVINEDLYLVLWPLLLGQHVVLDIFDSSFLKWPVPRWLVWLGQRLAYALPAKVIVTDADRAQLMPAFVKPKLVILPNYPFRYTGPVLPREPSLLRIYYTGSLLARRGTCLLEQLLAAANDVRVVMTGWIRDERTQQLAAHPRVEWLGVLPQQESIEQATRCDFILCHYEPQNLNNIYASPNKIYDAIQAGSGVIINPEARISRFVREKDLGVVLDAFEPSDLKILAQQLRDFKTRYQPDPALRELFLWEAIEPLLMAAHRSQV